MFAAIARTLFRGVSSRARILGLAFFGALGVGVGFIVAANSSGAEAAEVLADAYGLTLLIPVAALVFGTAAMGDPIEDGTYVYLWLRPIRRWQISAAAFAVTVSLVVPLAVVPTVLAALVVDSSATTVTAVAVSSLMAAVAYSAVFVLLGQVTQRALVWGIAYLLIFEEFICRGGRSLGFLSVHSHAVSMLARSLDITTRLAYFSRATSVIMTIVITVVLVAYSSRRQSMMNVA